MPKLNLNPNELVAEQALGDWVEQLVGQEIFRPGLERIRPLFERWASRPEAQARTIITVAGTNGKGQTAMEIAEQLEAAGKSVALWTSPHILSVRERLWPYPKADQLKELVTSVNNLAHRLEISLSYYELLFAAFCRWAESKQAEYWVLEVGLGGRLDATNLFDADFTLLTSISRDHEAILGPGEPKILREKLGITRPKTPLFSGLIKANLRSLCQAYCLQHKVPLIELSSEESHFVELPYEQRNIRLAHRALKAILGKSWEAKNLTGDSKGRFEQMTLGGQRFIFIGAHNIEGTQEVIATLTSGDREDLTPFSLALLGLSLRPEEEIRAIAEAWKQAQGLYDRIYQCEFDHPRAYGPKNYSGQGKCDFDQNFKTTLRKYFNQAPKHRVLVVGSYYFIGEVQKYLLRHHS